MGWSQSERPQTLLRTIEDGKNTVVKIRESTILRCAESSLELDHCNVNGHKIDTVLFTKYSK